MTNSGLDRYDDVQTYTCMSRKNFYPTLFYYKFQPPEWKLDICIHEGRNLKENHPDGRYPAGFTLDVHCVETVV
jgi:hypothetical protein